MWGPVLAWSVLRQLGSDGVERVAAFDRMLMREALAESFGALGMDHDGKWSAAARVRVLLQYGESAEADWYAMPASFWDEPDVRWLAGINEAGGKTYLNKEKLEDSAVVDDAAGA